MQKKVGDALYVLDLTPYVITEDTDVSIIYVQNEKVKEYKELNTELASKMHGFNQFIMAVQPLPWAEEGGEDSGDTLYTLTVNCDSTFASLAAGNQFGVVGRCTPDNKPALEGDTGYYTPAFIYDEQNPEQVIGFAINDMPEGCQFQFDERMFPAGFNLTSSPVLEHGTDDLAGLGQTYVMPASDVTISLSVQDDVEPGNTYTLTVNYGPIFSSAVSEIDPGALTQICGKGDETHQASSTGVTDWVFPSSTTNDEQNQYVVEAVYSNIPEGWQFQFDERKFPAGFNLTSSPVLENGTESLWGIGQTYMMPASDVTVTLTAQEVDPDETEYLSPRITGVNNDVNNFNVGAILNVKDNTALVNALEFTGHAEQGSTSSLDEDVDYMMGTPFSLKFDENDPAEYFSLCYQSTNDGHKFAIHLANAAGGNYPVNYYTIDSYDLNSIEDDHTYRIGLAIDISDAQTNGIVSVLPTFAIDGNTYTPRDVEGNTLNKPAGLDFDISQGTQALVDWVTNFQANVYLFGCDDGANWGEFTTTTLPFELSTVKVEYSTGADLSQLQVGTEATPWILTATSPNTFDDGIDDWSLSPMRSLVPNAPHIFKLTGNNIHDHVQVNLNGVQQSASAAEWVEGLLVAEGTNILIRALESSDQYTLQSGSINWSNDEQAWYTNMPNEDLEICIDYNGAPE